MFPQGFWNTGRAEGEVAVTLQDGIYCINPIEYDTWKIAVINLKLDDSVFLPYT